MVENYKTSSLMLSVTTYELRGNDRIAIMTHTFYADTQQELFEIMETHKQMDALFRSSFEGSFKWKKEITMLHNSEPFISYP